MNFNYPVDITCGIIPLRYHDGVWQTLIVQSKKGNWGFSKGHKNAGESDQQAAERELFEETGLQIKTYLHVDPLSFSYDYHEHAIHKKVILFLASVIGHEKICPTELQAAEWIAVDRVHEKINFETSRQMIVELQNIVALRKCHALQVLEK